MARTSIASTLALAAAAAVLAGCASTAPPAGTAPVAPPPAKSTASRATVNLSPASASLVSGTLTLVPMGDGVHITGEVGEIGRAHV